jgi:hypothetical protein
MPVLGASGEALALEDVGGDCDVAAFELGPPACGDASMFGDEQPVNTAPTISVTRILPKAHQSFTSTFGCCGATNYLEYAEPVPT